MEGPSNPPLAPGSQHPTLEAGCWSPVSPCSSLTMGTLDVFFLSQGVTMGPLHPGPQ